MPNKPFALGNVSAVVAADVTNTSTLTVPYPTGQTQASLTGSTGGVLVTNDNEAYPQAASGAGTFAASFGASNITITNNSGVTWAAGARLLISFGGYDHKDSAQGAASAAIANLTAATGTASDTIADVTGTFSQSILNNNLKSLSDKLNAALTALRNAGLIN